MQAARCRMAGTGGDRCKRHSNTCTGSALHDCPHQTDDWAISGEQGGAGIEGASLSRLGLNLELFIKNTNIHILLRQ